MKLKICCLVLLLGVLPGCFSVGAIKSARPKPAATADEKEPCRAFYPAYYLLLPLTVPADVVTLPFQVWLYFEFEKMKSLN
jgi:hypothetical protein